jgi:hypothetical protein
LPFKCNLHRYSAGGFDFAAAAAAVLPGGKSFAALGASGRGGRGGGGGRGSCDGGRGGRDGGRGGRGDGAGGGCTRCIKLTHSLKPFYLSSETVLPIK